MIKQLNKEHQEKDISFVFQRGAKVNIFSPTQIKSVGGIETFNQMIENDKVIELPKITFTDEEWEVMLQQGI